LNAPGNLDRAYDLRFVDGSPNPARLILYYQAK
jgi:hypothetical protein